MLDVRIFCGKKFETTGLLDTGVFAKPTFQGSCLSHRSGHHPNVHLSWPKSKWNHFAPLCSSKGGTTLARAEFFSKLYQECPDHPALRYLFNPHRHTRKAVLDPGSWLVIPYHPCWHAAKVARVLRMTKFLFLFSGSPIPPTRYPI